MNFISVLASLPFYGVWLTAIVLAVLRWQNHPTTSALVVTGGVLQLLGSAARFIGPLILQQSGGREAMTFIYAGLSFLATCGLGCLVAAVFVERPNKSGAPTLPR